MQEGGLNNHRGKANSIASNKDCSVKFSVKLFYVFMGVWWYTRRPFLIYMLCTYIHSYVVYIHGVCCVNICEFVHTYVRTCTFGFWCICSCVRALSFAQTVFVALRVVFTIDLTIQCSDPWRKIFR